MFKTLLSVALASTVAISSNALAAPGKNPGEQSIVAIAASDPANFSTLVTLVEFAELDGVLSGPGQFTVFAPTNAAFDELIAALTDALGAETVASLLADKDFVTNVLLYHVTDGRRFSNSVVNSNNPKSIEMLNGDYIFSMPDLTIMDGSSLTGDAGILIPDINASNGVIHVIDSVLVP
jgi:uncharacterized surface protein with fasciclin (FAS1) repeats